MGAGVIICARPPKLRLHSTANLRTRNQNCQGLNPKKRVYFRIKFVNYFLVESFIFLKALAILPRFFKLTSRFALRPVRIYQLIFKTIRVSLGYKSKELPPMTERALFKGVVNMIIRDGDKILLFLRNDGFFNHNGGYWVIPAGHIEAHETAQAAATREAKEELDIDIAPADIKFAHIISNLASHTECFEFFFVVNKYAGTIKNCEGDKCVTMRWFTMDEIRALPQVVKTTRIALDAIERGDAYSECQSYN